MAEEIDKLKSELNYLRQIKEALDKTTIISKTDPEGNITDANEMFEKISGYTKEELIGKPHNIVRHPDMPKSLFKKMWDTIKKGKIFRGVIKNRKKDGSEYYVLANIVPIKDEKGNIQEYIAIRQDITKRMQLQKENETFINNILNYFLTKLKNPSSTINKYSDLISKELEKENPLLEKIKEYNINIKREALTIQRMEKAFKVALDFKKKKVEVVATPINILKILSFLFRKYKHIYKKKIKFKFKNPEIIIITDKNLILLMMEILYSNALKYSKSEVIVSVIEKEKKVYVIIENDGPKIEEKLTIFDFLNQLKRNTSSKAGIGMFVVKKIVDYFEYNIKIEDNKIIVELSKVLPAKFL